MSNQKFPSRAGSLDYGTIYEILMSAYYGFRLSLSSKVDDFKLSTNNNDMGNFDDVVLEVKFAASNENIRGEHLFAIQLKHCAGKADSIPLAAFDGAGGNFALLKYCKEFINIRKMCKSGEVSYSASFENFHFILLTNQVLPKFHRYENKTKIEVDEMELSKKSNLCLYRHDQCVGDTLLDFSEAQDSFVYKFKTKKQDELDPDFLNNFFLYTKQKNTKEVERLLSKLILQVFENCDASVVTNYFNFFKLWWRGDYGYIKLTKKDIILKLAEYVLIPSVPNVSFELCFVKNFEFKDSEYNAKLDLLHHCMLQFDLTLIESEVNEDLEQQIWGCILKKHFSCYLLDKNSLWLQSHLDLEKNFLPDNTTIPVSAKGANFNNFSLKSIYTVLWHLDLLPMFVKTDDKNKKATLEAITLCQNLETETKKKFVVLGNELLEEQFGNIQVFKNLSDLLSCRNFFDKITEEIQISLQGRERISLKRFVNEDSSLMKLISVKQIFEMMSDKFTIGASREDRDLKYYVKRRLPKILLNSDVIPKTPNDIFVVNSKHIKDYHTKLNIIDSSKYLLLKSNEENITSEIFIIAIESEEEFAQISAMNRNKSCHYVQIIDRDRVEWLKSQGSVKNLKQHQLTDFDNFKDNDFVEDSNALQHFSNRINLICAGPGMGKSVMLNFFKHHCPSNFWLVKINICEHVKFFKGLPSVEEALEHLLNTESRKNKFEQNIVDHFSARKRVLFLWDGFDELPQTCVNSVADLINNLAREGYRHWISARSNSRDLLENSFGVIALTLTNFSFDDQKQYIYHHLKDKYDDDHNLAEMVHKLVENMMISLKCGYFDYTGVPLQVYMVLEIFLKNPKKYLKEFKIISLTDIYQEYVEGKFSALFEKANANLNNPRMQKIQIQYKNSQLALYETAALKSSFDEETFSSLNINCDKFLENLKINKDLLGFIFGLNDDNQPIFTHKTYEEFLTASWLLKNCKTHSRLIEVIFEEDYSNIRLMFDMLSAKNSPIHVAVLYKNLSFLQNFDDDFAKCKDVCGRNLLQVACAWGDKHPLVEVSQDEQNKTVIYPRSDFKVTDSKTVDFLLNKGCNPLEEDELFGWNAIDYSDRSLSLSAVEAIASCNHSINFQEMVNFKDIYSVLYYSVKCNYTNLLEHLGDYPYIDLKLGGDEVCSLLHFAVRLDRLYMVEKLLLVPRYREAINNPYKDFGNLLYTAASNGNLTMFKLLQKNGAVLDHNSSNSMSPLVSCVHYGFKDFCQKLLEDGANANQYNILGNSVLQIAAMRNHVGVMDLLLQYGAEVDYVSNDLTALDYCIDNGCLEGVKLLISHKANFRRSSQKLYGYTPLHSACERGHDEIVKYLIQMDAELTTKSNKLYTPLHVALLNSQRSTAKILLKADSSVINEYTEEKHSPIIFASLSNFSDVVKTLAELGADVNSSESKLSPLHIATLKGFEECVFTLIQSGACVNNRDDSGNPPLFYAINNPKILQLFLNNSSSNVNFKTETSMTALHFAALNGQTTAVEELIKHGACIDAQDSKNETPLHYAIKQKFGDVVRCLLKHKPNINNPSEFMCLAALNDDPDSLLPFLLSGVDVDAQNEEGLTALHIASIKSLTCVKILLRNGASVHICAQNGFSPLCLSIFFGKMDIIEELIRNGADRNTGFGPSTALHLAAGLGDIATLIFLKNFDCDIDAEDDKKRTPLHCATSRFAGRFFNSIIQIVKKYKILTNRNCNFESCVRFLVKNGANVNASTIDGYSPMHFAAARGNLEMVEFLVESGSDVNACNNHGNCSLFVAASGGFVDIVSFLCDRGAALNTVDDDGDTPLHDAASLGHLPVVEYLIAKKADLKSYVNKNGKTPLDLALDNKKTEVVNILQADLNDL